MSTLASMIFSRSGSGRGMGASGISVRIRSCRETSAMSIRGGTGRAWIGLRGSGGIFGLDAERREKSFERVRRWQIGRRSVQSEQPRAIHAVDEHVIANGVVLLARAEDPTIDAVATHHTILSIFTTAFGASCWRLMAHF